MLNRLLYRLVTLPAIVKAGCLGTLGVFFACSCLFLASIPGASARAATFATQTAVAHQVEITQRALASTATSIAHTTATAQTGLNATATGVAHVQQATQTAEAAPAVTAQAALDATNAAYAASTATSQAVAAATGTSIAQATVLAGQTAEAIAAEQAAAATAQAAAQESTATAQAAAEAAATLDAYRKKMPKGFWYGKGGGVGVSIGDFRYEKETPLYAAGKGKKFVAFGIGVFNESGATIHVNPLNVTLVDLEGNTYAFSTATFDYWSEPLQAVNVLSGNQAQGGVVFLIPAETAPAKIVYETNTLFGDKIIVDLQRPPDEKQ